jgi:hypothetical protein
LPAEKIDVRMRAFTICGRIGISISSIAITYGEEPAPGLASDNALWRLSFEYGITIPMQREPRTKKVVKPVPK